MTPPPKPVTLSEETFCDEVANGPRLASSEGDGRGGPALVRVGGGLAAAGGAASAPAVARTAASGQAGEAGGGTGTGGGGW